MRNLVLLLILVQILIVTISSNLGRGPQSSGGLVSGFQEEGEETAGTTNTDEEDEDNDAEIPTEERGEAHLPPKPKCCEYQRNCACITPEHNGKYGSRRLARGAVELVASNSGSKRDVTLFSLRYREHSSIVNPDIEEEEEETRGGGELSSVPSSFDPSVPSPSSRDDEERSGSRTPESTQGGTVIPPSKEERRAKKVEEQRNLTLSLEVDPSVRHMMQDLVFEVDLQTFHPRVPGTDDDFAYTGARRGSSGIRNNISSAEMRSHRHLKQMLGSPFPKLLVQSEFVSTPPAHLQGQNTKGGFTSASSAMAGPPGSDDRSQPQFDAFDQESMGWYQRDHIKTSNPDWLHRATVRFQMSEREVRKQPVLFALVWRTLKADSEHDPWSWKNEQEKIFQAREAKEKGEDDSHENGYIHWHYRPAAELNAFVPIAKWQSPASRGTMENASYQYWDRHGINVLLNGSTFLRLIQDSRSVGDDDTNNTIAAGTFENGAAHHKQQRSLVGHILDGVDFHQRQLFYVLRTRWGVHTIHIIGFFILLAVLIHFFRRIRPEERPTLRGTVEVIRVFVSFSWTKLVEFLRWTNFLPPLPQVVGANSERRRPMVPSPTSGLSATPKGCDAHHLAESPKVSMTTAAITQQRLFNQQQQLAGTRSFNTDGRGPKMATTGGGVFGGGANLSRLGAFGVLDLSGSSGSSDGMSHINHIAAATTTGHMQPPRGAHRVQQPALWQTGDPRWDQSQANRVVEPSLARCDDE